MNIAPFTNLNLETLDQAVDLVRVNKLATGSRETAFLRAYPALLAAIRVTDRDADAFLLAATFAYGWLPGRLHIEPQSLDAAVRAFGRARAPEAAFAEADAMAVATCLQSLVAASQVLHFANPAVYPTWDARIEGFRRGQKPTPYHMTQTINYAAYVMDIQGVKRQEGFPGFHFDFCMNYQERLRHLSIPPFPLTDMKVIESAVGGVLLAQGGGYCPASAPGLTPADATLPSSPPSPRYPQVARPHGTDDVFDPPPDPERPAAPTMAAPLDPLATWPQTMPAPGLHLSK